MKKSKRLTCSPSHMKVTGRRIRDILMIGIPASITNIMQIFMMVMTNNFLLTYGTDKVAAMGIASSGQSGVSSQRGTAAVACALASEAWWPSGDQR